MSRRENDLDNLYLPEYLSLPGHEFGGSVGGGQSGRIAGTRKLSSGGSCAEAAANKTLGLGSRWISPAHFPSFPRTQVISRGAGGPPLAPHGLGKRRAERALTFLMAPAFTTYPSPASKVSGMPAGAGDPKRTPL